VGRSSGLPATKSAGCSLITTPEAYYSEILCAMEYGSSNLSGAFCHIWSLFCRHIIVCVQWCNKWRLEVELGFTNVSRNRYEKVESEKEERSDFESFYITSEAITRLVVIRSASFPQAKTWGQLLHRHLKWRDSRCRRLVGYLSEEPFRATMCAATLSTDEKSRSLHVPVKICLLTSPASLSSI
jgi:hypothetical protein